MRQGSVVALLVVFSLFCSCLVMAQGRRRNNRRSDTTPIELAGGSRVEFRDMDSEALSGKGKYSIFFPPSYAKGDASYPVVYFLHGLFNDHTSWTVSRHGNLPAILDDLMTKGKIPEMLLVHPDGGRSFYTNSKDGSSKHEDFVVQELVKHVEASFRARKGRASRAIAGTSMGGYGALKIAMRHPDQYAAVAAHSAIVFAAKNPLDVPPEMKSTQMYGFFSNIFNAIFGDPLDQAYYDENNPLVLARTRDLGDLAVYFDYGTSDRYVQSIRMDLGLQSLAGSLREAGVEPRFQVHQGEPHGWALVVSHIEESMSFIAESF